MPFNVLASMVWCIVQGCGYGSNALASMVSCAVQGCSYGSNVLASAHYRDADAAKRWLTVQRGRLVNHTLNRHAL